MKRHKILITSVVMVCCLFFGSSIAQSVDSARITEWNRQLRHATEVKDWNQQIDLLKKLAKYYSDQKQTAPVLPLYEKAIAISKEHVPQTLPGIYVETSMFCSRYDMPVKALEYAIKAEDAVERSQLQPGQLAEVYGNLLITYSYITKYDAAVVAGRKAISMAETAKDTSLIIESYINLTSMLPSMGQEGLTFQLLDSLTQKYTITNPVYQFYIASIYTNLYIRTGDAERAGVFFKKIMQLPKEVLESPDVRDQFLYTATYYYTSTGQYALAKPYVLKREALLQNAFSIVDKAKNERFLFLADSASGDYISAIRHLQAYIEWKDSVFRLQKAKQLDQLQVAYNTEKKDKDIVLLKQRNALQNATIKNEQLMRNFVIVGIAILLLLLILIYNRYQLKQRANLDLEVKQAEINRQNEQLKKLLGEKEWLLKEIHHRVKNNLQIVISLLNTQSAFLENEDAIQAIKNSQHRMHAMSLIHQKLYQTDNLAVIDMQWYIRELLSYMTECFENAGKITFNVATDAVALDVAQAVPLGLILNEAISNAIKYAFPEDRKGMVSIELKWQSEKLCRLRIADNGIGTPEGFDWRETESLGMSLMRGLSEQLEAAFDVQSCSGMIITVVFSVGNNIAETATGAVKN